MYENGKPSVELAVAAVTLPDIQKTPDQRNIPIDRVGVKRVKYPIRVLDRANEIQHTVGEFTLLVDLPAHHKGTHMSRFLEILSENQGEVSVHSLPRILSQLRERLTAANAFLEVDFTLFVSKPAPVTGKVGMMGYHAGLRARAGAVDEMVMHVVIPVATLCPCSKEISAFGAHNQRGYVTIEVEATDHIWIEELIEMVEAASSAPLYPVLKRPDEKFVTEQAYQNPRFVEDMVREVAIAFNKDSRISRYKVEVENHESIHDHNAYAVIERTK